MHIRSAIPKTQSENRAAAKTIGPRRLVALAALVGAAAVGGLVTLRLLTFQDPAQRIDANTSATNELAVPPLLTGNQQNGVSHYDLTLAKSSHEFFDGVATDTIAYNGQSLLGPTIEVQSGDTVKIDVTNKLDTVTTTHWHGADVPAAADGGPHSTIKPAETWSPQFDIIQPAATLWYHPHRMDLTAEQVYAGGAGLLIVRDDNKLAASLPSTYGIDDIPLVFQDRNFDEDGQMNFEINGSGRGRQMETLTINGTVDPYVEVPAGLVRLRLVNGSQARIYKLGVEGSRLHKIASDGGYLNQPVELDQLALAPGDRAEIVVEVGSEPVTITDSAFGRVVELRPNGDTSTGTSLPPQLNQIEPITADDIDVDRTFDMAQHDEHWGINGASMDMNVINERIRFGDTERWTITVDNGQHTFHVHQTQFQILSINGEPPPPEESGWEDTVWVNGGRTVVIAARFDSYTNPDIPYMYHCHILDHEDLGMMGQFNVTE